MHPHHRLATNRPHASMIEEGREHLSPAVKGQRAVFFPITSSQPPQFNVRTGERANESVVHLPFSAAPSPIHLQRVFFDFPPIHFKDVTTFPSLPLLPCPSPIPSLLKCAIGGL